MDSILNMTTGDANKSVLNVSSLLITALFLLPVGSYREVGSSMFMVKSLPECMLV